MEQSSLQIPVDPNDLLIFARVAELGSFSRAAEKSGLPKSTVSRRLAALEQQLGEKLLLRTTRRQTLTEFGLQLLEHARQVAAEVQAVTALRERRQATPSGRLRVSMPSDFANLLLADTLAAFVALYPAIELALDLSPRRVDLLGEGFDVAVRLGALPDDAMLVARKLAVFPIGLYAAPSYLADHGEPGVPDDLARFEAIRMLQGNDVPASWSLVQGDTHWQGLAPGRASANSPELLIKLACAGAGIAAVPDYFAAPEVRRGTLRRVLADWCLPSDTAWAVFPERRLMPAKTRVFINMLQTALAQVPA
ncbi:LysR family transcriptional regulator [Rhodoferax sp.]|uniref:LysR family transcriptional regulator n=1 Tax=Rhodoferax sp. TaxID=50421 RepID=UPI0026366044|nr:LysR family transcriptional regulator [Rhodoferax sp.]MDD2924985.1 LysR family transcriptional regulator [Rhodoferax sp.]